MKRLSISIAAMLLLVGIAHAKPNIIFIMTDDQGYGDLGCYGHPSIKTPNIDRMAEEGVRLGGFYARHKCTPARACLMTGAYNFRVGIKDIVHPHDNVGMCQEAATIPEVLKPQGYTSICIGKWHLGHALGYLPTDQGFDSYFGVPGTNHGDSMNHGLPVAKGFQPGGALTMEDYEKDAGGKKGERTILMRNQEVVEWPTDISRLTVRYTQEAVKFIKANQDKPFFLYLAHGTPHHPYTVSKEFRGKSAHGLYGDMIEEIDWSVGEVLKAVKELGLDENTLVIFTSDNGADGKPDKVHDEKGSCLPLRDWKGSNYEGGSRVPFVARWPKRIPAGKEVDEIASLLDMLPTFAKLAGAEVDAPQKIDGKDIWGMLANGDTSPHEYIYYGGNGSIAAIRNRTFKYFPGKRDKLGNLYNLKTDIAETTDVAEEYPEIAKELGAALAVFQKDLDENSLEAPINTGVKKGGGKKTEKKKKKKK